MSAAVNATRTIASTQHDISQLVLSRKRKLRELYEVTCSTDPTPRVLLVPSPDKPSQDTGLAAFLDRNDIERGRYFEESSLPLRPTARPHSESSSSLTYSKSSKQAHLDPPGLAEHGEAQVDRDVPGVALPEPAQHVSRKPSPNQPYVSRDTFEAAGLPPESGVDQVSKPSTSRVPRIDTDLDGSDQPLRKSRPAKLESPPLSPATGTHDELTASDSGQALPDVLTPRKEAYDLDTVDQNYPETVNQVSQAEHDQNHDLAKPSNETGSALPGSISSQSSGNGRRSTNTSRTGPQSPATSPDDEDEARPQHLTAPSASDPTVQSHKASKVAFVQAERARADAQTPPGGRSPGHPELSTIDQVHVPHASPQQSRLLPSLASGAGKHFNQPRINKAKSRTTKKFILSWTKRSERWHKHQDHIIAAAEQPRLSVEYYRPFVSCEALNNQHSRPLQSLLENRAKVLSTIEREIGQREEAARLVLLRIKHLQDQARWSLRSMKPSTEPEYQGTFWDQLVDEARWLRTDFKEERKLKLSVAKMLADWCAEFVSSDPDSRRALSVRKATTNPKPVIVEADVSAGVAQDLDDPCAGPMSEEDGVILLDDTCQALKFEGRSVWLDEKVLDQVPAFARKLERSGDLELPFFSRAVAVPSRASRSESPAEQLVDIPPEGDSCALFSEGGKSALRKKINMVVHLKPPNRIISPMPGQGFYETRAASQWNDEDDELLRQNIRQHPANWLLISQELSSKSEFVPGSDRRTVWECFERSVMLELNPGELPNRPYLKPFYSRYSQARSHFDESQRAMQQQLQQARENGQNTPIIPPKAFPEPRKVDRKPSRRFMALLDAARRLARKRETAATKQERSQHNEARPQQNPPGLTRIPHDPKFYHARKHEQELKESVELQKFQEHRKALYAAQHKQQAGYPASLTHGIGQQMQSGMAGSTSVANGHLAVPVTNRYPRPNQQQLNGPMGVANGSSVRSQVPVPGRPQTAMQGQRNMSQMNSETMANYMQHQTIQQRFQNAAHPLQSQPAPQAGQMPRASPNLNQVMPNGGIQNSNENGESYNSPNLHQAAKHQHSNSNSSNPTQQALAAAAGHSYVGMNGNRPQALSSGQVPHLSALRHQIQNKNPGISQEAATQQATEALKSYATHNAMSAASGMASPGQVQQLQQQRTSQAMRTGGSQSPYQQHAVPTPQMQSPYQQSGVLASSQFPQSNHNVYPTGVLSAQQQQYQRAMQKQMFNQQMYQMTPGQSASSVTTSHSPHMGQAGFAASSNIRTPGQMRPPSRSASGYEISQQYPQHDLQRPGSATNPAQSPRPVSAQGFGHT